MHTTVGTPFLIEMQPMTLQLYNYELGKEFKILKNGSRNQAISEEIYTPIFYWKVDILWKWDQV